MTDHGIVAENVWKRFHRGQLHDSLRDLVPALAKRLVGRGAKPHELGAGDFWALRAVSFEVRPGEAIGVIGPNGAGKSTLLKILNRILRPNRGSVTIRGRVGALIEVAAGFHPDLTGRENIYLQGAIMGMKRAEIARKLPDIVEFSGVSDFINTPVKRYSTGMNARLGFSIAAHLDPEVLLIDEVLAVGDLSFQQRSYERLTEFRRSGIPLVFVSHNMRAVSQICDRGLLLGRGREPIIGAVNEILLKYTSASLEATDSRVTLRPVKLVTADTEHEVQRPIAPGTRLKLVLDVQANAELLRCGLSLVLARADGTIMFDGSSSAYGVPRFDLRSGQIGRFAIEFETPLPSDTYRVGTVLVDGNQLWDHVRLLNLASFSVAGNDRTSGYVDVRPIFHISV
jgi:lipopolysaccharide transport system ATP-binding protein